MAAKEWPEMKEVSVVLHRLTDKEIQSHMSNKRSRPERAQKKIASKNLRDISRLDFTMFETYRNNRKSFLKKKKKKGKEKKNKEKKKTELKVSTFMPIAPKEADFLPGDPLIGTFRIINVVPNSMDFSKDTSNKKEKKRKRKSEAKGEKKPPKKKKYKRNIIQSDSDGSMDGFGIVYDNPTYASLEDSSFTLNNFRNEQMVPQQYSEIPLNCEEELFTNPYIGEDFSFSSRLYDVLDLQRPDDDLFPEMGRFNVPLSSNCLESQLANGVLPEDSACDDYNSEGSPMSLALGHEQIMAAVKDKYNGDNKEFDFVSRIIQEMDNSLHPKKQKVLGLNMESVQASSASNDYLQDKCIQASSSSHSLKELPLSEQAQETAEKSSESVVSMNSQKCNRLLVTSACPTKGLPVVQETNKNYESQTVESACSGRDNSFAMQSDKKLLPVPTTVNVKAVSAKQGTLYEKPCSKSNTLIDVLANAVINNTTSNSILAEKSDNSSNEVLGDLDNIVSTIVSDMVRKVSCAKLPRICVRCSCVYTSYDRKCICYTCQKFSAQTPNRILRKIKSCIISPKKDNGFFKIKTRNRINYNQLVEDGKKKTNLIRSPPQNVTNRMLTRRLMKGVSASELHRLTYKKSPLKQKLASKIKEIQMPNKSETAKKQTRDLGHLNSRMTKKTLAAQKCKSETKAVSKVVCNIKSKKELDSKISSKAKTTAAVVSQYSPTNDTNNLNISNSSTKGDYYTVESDRRGLLLVNVPELDSEYDICDFLENFPGKEKLEVSKNEVPKTMKNSKETLVPTVGQSTDGSSPEGDLSYTYQLPGSETVLVAHYASDKENKSDFELSKVYLKNNETVQSVTVNGQKLVVTPSTSATQLVSSATPYQSSSNSTMQLVISSVRSESQKPSLSDESVAKSPSANSTNEVSSSLNDKETDSLNETISSSKNERSSTHTPSNEPISSSTLTVKSSTPTPSSHASTDAAKISKDAKLYDPTYIALFEIDAYSILSTLDLDCNNDSLLPKLKNLIEKQQKELQKIQMMYVKCSNLENRKKLHAQLKYKLNHVQSYLLAKSLWVRYGSIEKIADALSESASSTASDSIKTSEKSVINKVVNILPSPFLSEEILANLKKEKAAENKGCMYSGKNTSSLNNSSIASLLFSKSSNQPALTSQQLYNPLNTGTHTMNSLLGNVLLLNSSTNLSPSQTLSSSGRLIGNLIQSTSFPNSSNSGTGVSVVAPNPILNQTNISAGPLQAVAPLLRMTNSQQQPMQSNATSQMQFLAGNVLPSSITLTQLPPTSPITANHSSPRVANNNQTSRPASSHSSASPVNKSPHVPSLADVKKEIVAASEMTSSCSLQQQSANNASNVVNNIPTTNVIGTSYTQRQITNSQTMKNSTIINPMIASLLGNPINPYSQQKQSLPQHSTLESLLTDCGSSNRQHNSTWSLGNAQPRAQRPQLAMNAPLGYQNSSYTAFAALQNQVNNVNSRAPINPLPTSSMPMNYFARYPIQSTNQQPVPNNQVRFPLNNQMPASSSSGIHVLTSPMVQTPIRVQQVVLGNSSNSCPNVTVMNTSQSSRPPIASSYNSNYGANIMTQSNSSMNLPVQTTYYGIPAMPPPPYQIMLNTQANDVQMPFEDRSSGDFLSDTQCKVCGKQATMRCKQCTKVVYCGTDCAKYYWNLRHRNECCNTGSGT